MSIVESLHTNSKYGVLVVTCAIVGIFGVIFSYEIFNLYGKVFGAVTALFFIAIIIGIVNSFKNTGFKEYTFEEALIAHTPDSAVSICEVRIRDPTYGKIWFQEKGKLIITQVGAMFYYGWPFINGHRLLRINTLDAQDASGGLVDIESNVGPDTCPDGLWFDTSKAIKVKANKLLDYQEYKNITSAYEMVQKQGQINRMRFGGDVKAMQNTGITSISIDDLNQREA